MTYRDGIRRDIQAKRDRAAAEERTTKINRIGDIVGLAKSGQISERKALEVVRQILDGDADRVVRIGDEHKPKIEG